MYWTVNWNQQWNEHIIFSGISRFAGNLRLSMGINEFLPYLNTFPLIFLSCLGCIFPIFFSSAQISHFQDLKKKHSHFFTFFPKLFETFWKRFKKIRPLRGRFVTPWMTLSWVSIYRDFTTIFYCFLPSSHVFNTRNAHFSSCISHLRCTFRPKHPKKLCNFNLPGGNFNLPSYCQPSNFNLPSDSFNLPGHNRVTSVNWNLQSNWMWSERITLLKPRAVNWNNIPVLGR